MQIDFKALEQALAPIEEIGQGELTFDAGGTSVTLRIMLPDEEIAVQRFAGKALAGDDDDANSAVEYLDRFRCACLGYAIVEVGGVDFRHVEFVETGEVLENGNVIKVTKDKAVRELTGRWTRPVLTRAFRKYSDLVNIVEKKADLAIEFLPSDDEAEIERLESRAQELRDKAIREAAEGKDQFATKVQVAARAAEAEGVEDPPEVPVVDEPQVNPEQLATPVARQAVRRQGPISPQGATPPPQRTTIAQPDVGSEPLVERREPARPDTSFINSDDDESMNAAMDNEHRRIAERRRRSAQGQAPMDEGSALNTIHPQVAPRRPPHMDAAEVEAEMGTAGIPMSEEELDGKPVLRMPDVALEQPAPPRQTSPRDRAPVNQSSPPTSKNPRFVSPNKT